MSDQQERLRLVVILGSTRPERLCTTVAGWFLPRVGRDSRFSVDRCDLAEIDLPNDLSGAGDTEAFSKRIGCADAVVIITPEYNRGYPAVLKSAIDTVWEEWRAKPIGFVSYGGISGGLRAVEQLRGVFGELHAVTLRDAVSIPDAGDAFDGNGQLRRPRHPDNATDVLLQRLAWWARAMRDALQHEPYPS